MKVEMKNRRNFRSLVLFSLTKVLREGFLFGTAFVTDLVFNQTRGEEKRKRENFAKIKKSFVLVSALLTEERERE